MSNHEIEMPPKAEEEAKSAAVPSSSSSSSSPTESPDAADAPSPLDATDARGFNIPGYRAHLHQRDQHQHDALGDFSTLTEMEDAAYNLSEGVRLAVVFNHERFSNGLADRKGTMVDCEVRVCRVIGKPNRESVSRHMRD